jgi:hypothetical protein
VWRNDHEGPNFAPGEKGVDVPGVASPRSVARAEKIVEAALRSGDSSLKRLHEEAKQARLQWVAFERVKEKRNLTTVRRPHDGRLAWTRQASEEAAA